MRELKFRMYALDIQKMFEMDRLHLPCTTEPNPASVYMQYTGLKDKNGKEIYEGDVLKDEFGLGEVKWIQEHCSFVIYVPEKGYYFLESGDAQSLKSSEVLGNIYENPEWEV